MTTEGKVSLGLNPGFVGIVMLVAATWVTWGAATALWSWGSFFTACGLAKYEAIKKAEGRARAMTAAYADTLAAMDRARGMIL